MTVTVNGKAVAHDQGQHRPGRSPDPRRHPRRAGEVRGQGDEVHQPRPADPEVLINGKKNPDYYDEKELWATRISNAGAFIHFNPKTLKVQGVAAASHGCVNTNEAAAKAFYELSVPGDIVKVINSPAPPNVNDCGHAGLELQLGAWTAGSALQS